jgi:hypothetical protein
MNKSAYKFSQNIITPDVITNSKDFYFFYSLNSRENYITKKTKVGEIVLLNKFTNFKSVSKKLF